MNDIVTGLASARSGGKRAAPANDQPAEYLSLLGRRVRSARVRRGMTRKILARDSGVSERYLAQLEAGDGNISIALLRRVAEAMGLPLAELVREGPDRPIELTLLIQRLERLGHEQLIEGNRLLAERFQLDRGADRHARIALIGLRGAGKTTLGRLLAARLECPFMEMADEITSLTGMSLEQIFDLSGQAGYRRYERRALEQILARHQAFVLATGGSIVSDPGTFDLLLQFCFTIWVKASPEEHMSRVIAQGDMRPMAGNTEAMQDLKSILAERDALYRRADAVLSTAGKSVPQSLGELIKAIIPPTAK
jgi:XRE family aerobic/anaerobic benzoate catabolism transcriptional regulator